MKTEFTAWGQWEWIWMQVKHLFRIHTKVAYWRKEHGGYIERAGSICPVCWKEWPV